MRLAGAAGEAQRLAERRIRAEVEHLRQVAGGLLPEQGEAEAGGGDAGRPADRDDLGTRERDAGVGGEGCGVDRAGRVVGGTNALQGENGGIGALLEPGRSGMGALAGLVADVRLLQSPERERHDDGRDRAGEQGERKSEANRHLAECSAG